MMTQDKKTTTKNKDKAFPYVSEEEESKEEKLYNYFLQLYPEFEPYIELADFLIAKALVINKVCNPRDKILLCTAIAHMCILRYAEKLPPELVESKTLVTGRATKGLKVGNVSGTYVTADKPADDWWLQTPYGQDVYVTCTNGGGIGVYGIDECGCGCG